MGNENVPIRLAQCRFSGLAIFNAKILLNFFKQNIREQFYQTAVGSCYGLKFPKRRLQFNRNVVSVHFIRKIN